MNITEKNVERKVKVDGPANEHMSSQMCVVVDYCEMGLMKEPAVVAFYQLDQIYQFRRSCLYYTSIVC